MGAVSGTKTLRSSFKPLHAEAQPFRHEEKTGNQKRLAPSTYQDVGGHLSSSNFGPGSMWAIDKVFKLLQVIFVAIAPRAFSCILSWHIVGPHHSTLCILKSICHMNSYESCIPDPWTFGAHSSPRFRTMQCILQATTVMEANDVNLFRAALLGATISRHEL